MLSSPSILHADMFLSFSLLYVRFSFSRNGAAERFAHFSLANTARLATHHLQRVSRGPELVVVDAAEQAHDVDAGTAKEHVADGVWVQRPTHGQVEASVGDPLVDPGHGVRGRQRNYDGAPDWFG